MPVLGTARRLTKGQRAAAEVVTADARCTPVLVRPAITGPARMPRARLEICSPSGEVLGNVALPNTSAAFEPRQRWWLVGEPIPGRTVALVSDGGGQVVLPGGPLRAGPAEDQDFSAVACRFLGWTAPLPVAEAPPDASAEWAAVFTHGRHSISHPAFTVAVRRFRIAAVLIPLLFFLVCFPYLFLIPGAVHAGEPLWKLLALPVVGGGLTLWWSWTCRRRLVAEAERIEHGAARYGKAIAFTQSYWSGMRKPPASWTGPLPRACTGGVATAGAERPAPVR